MLTRTPWIVLPLLLAVASSCKKDDASQAAGGATTSADGGLAIAPALGAAPGTDTNAAAPLPGATGPSFEGAITMHMSDGKSPPHDVTLLTKGNKIRVDVPEKNGTSAHSIFDPATGKALVIMDSQKMAMTMTLPQGSMAAAQGGPPQVTKTGKHETIAGRDCEDWDIVQPSNGKHEQACITEGMVFFDFTSMSGPAASRGTMSGWLGDLRDKREFPMRAVTLDPSGKETSRMEVTKLDPKPIADSMFTVPAGYREMDMSKLSGLAGALGGKGLPH